MTRATVPLLLALAVLIAGAAPPASALQARELRLDDLLPAELVAVEAGYSLDAEQVLPFKQ